MYEVAAESLFVFRKRIQGSRQFVDGISLGDSEVGHLNDLFGIRHFQRQLAFGLGERAFADVQENHRVDVNQIVVHVRLFFKFETLLYDGRESVHVCG